MSRECAACKQQPATVLARLHRDEKSIVVPLCQQCLIRLSQKTRVEILEAIPAQESAEDEKVRRKAAHPTKRSKKPLLITLVVLLLLAAIVCSDVFILPLIKKAIQKGPAESTDTSMTPEQIYEYASVATVEITAIGDDFVSTGTGFFCDTDEYLITNYHVIDGTTDAYITIHDGGRYDITGFYGYDEEHDIALLTTTYKPQTVLKSCTELAQTGESVYVIGSSEGLTASFSSGIISNSQRDLDGLVFIQITAPISHGNSGGPVLNNKGEVIGISTAYIEEGQNLNFAIPISEKDIVIQSQEAIGTNGSSFQPNNTTSINFEKSFSSLWDFLTYYGRRGDTNLGSISQKHYNYEFKSPLSDKELLIEATEGTRDEVYEKYIVLILSDPKLCYLMVYMYPDKYPCCKINVSYYPVSGDSYDSFVELSIPDIHISQNAIHFEIQYTHSDEEGITDRWLYGQAKIKYNEKFNQLLSETISLFDEFLSANNVCSIAEFGFSD